MKRLLSNAGIATAALMTSSVALASGDSGTGSVTEMEAGPGTFFALLGAVVGMGVLVWLVLKFLNRPKK